MATTVRQVVLSVGLNFVRSAGDVYVTDDDEAQRLAEAGHAVIVEQFDVIPGTDEVLDGEPGEGIQIAAGDPPLPPVKRSRKKGASDGEGGEAAPKGADSTSGETNGDSEQPAA